MGHNFCVIFLSQAKSTILVLFLVSHLTFANIVICKSSIFTKLRGSCNLSNSNIRLIGIESNGQNSRIPQEARKFVEGKKFKTADSSLWGNALRQCTAKLELGYLRILEHFYPFPNFPREIHCIFPFPAGNKKVGKSYPKTWVNFLFFPYQHNETIHL